MTDGVDTIDGFTGFDVLSFAYSYWDTVVTAGVYVDLNGHYVTDQFGKVDTFANIEGVVGTRLNDIMVGTAGANRFEGLGGADAIQGGDGAEHDVISYEQDAKFNGSAGIFADLGGRFVRDGFGSYDYVVSIEDVIGTNSADYIKGGDVQGWYLDPSYRLQGLAGNDTLAAGLGLILATPGAGNDTIIGSAASGDTIAYTDYLGPVGIAIDLATGSVADPWGGIDTFSNIEGVLGTAGHDIMLGSAADDIFAGLNGSDYFDGRSGGNDTIRYDADAGNRGAGGVVVDLAAGYALDGFGSYDGFVSIESVVGTGSANQFYWGVSDFLKGSAAGNVMLGLGGADLIFGYGGDDALYGGEGDDMLAGGAGFDVIVGDSGLDTVDYSGAAGGIGVELYLDAASNDGDGGSDRLIDIERVIGSLHNDLIATDGADNVINGGSGNDQIYASYGDDYIVGGKGSDYLSGSFGYDYFVFSADDFQAGVFDRVADFGEGAGDYDFLTFQGLTSGSLLMSDYGTDVFITNQSFAGGILVSNMTVARLQDQLIFI